MIRRLFGIWRRGREADKARLSDLETRWLRELADLRPYLERLGQHGGRFATEHRRRLLARRLELETGLAMAQVRRVIGGGR